MDNKDLHFKGQQTNETLICFFRHHWIVLVREYLYCFIFFTIMVISLIRMHDIQNIIKANREFKLLFIFGFFISTVYLHHFFMKMINHYFEVCIVTDLRIIDHRKTLFFKDTMDAIDMGQIQNIERIGEGLLPYLFKYGDIKIYLSASSAVRTLTYVPNVNFHFRCITRQKEAIMQQARERHHEGLADKIVNIPVEEPYVAKF